MMNRRDLVTRGLTGAAALLTPEQLLAELVRVPTAQVPGRPWLAAAMKAER